MIGHDRTNLIDRAPAGVLFLLITLLTLLLYSQALTFDFINWDDPSYVTGNGLVRAGVTADGIRIVFTEMQIHNWHPVTMLSHMLDVELFGLDPAGHHATSLLVHAVNSGLLFLFLFYATRQKLPSLLVALLFAVHPTHVESVAWVSERKDVLSTLFLLLAMIAYVRISASIPKMVVVTVAIACGLMSKAMLVTAPLIFLLLDFWPLQRITLPQRGLALDAWWRSSGLGACLLEKLPLVLLALAISLVTLLAQTASYMEVDFATRVEHALVSYVLYLLKLFHPVGLAAFYPHYGAPPLLQLLAALGVLGAISAASLYYVRTHPYLLFGWAFFLVTLVPVIGFVQVGAQGLADRYLYIPSIGVFVALAWGYVSIWRALGGKLMLVLPALLLSLFSYQTLEYLPTWKNGVVLWKRALAVLDPGYLPFLASDETSRAFSDFPKGLVVPYLLMGEALIEVGRIDAGNMHFQFAVGMQPDNGELRRRVGLALLDAGRTQAARMHLEAARALGVTDARVEAALQEG